MRFLIENMLLLVVLAVLLGVSGVFSGTETVLFSLSRHDRARMKKSGNRFEAMAAGLLDNPRHLLTSLLIGNMTCNIVIFVLSTILFSRLEARLAGGAEGAGVAGGAGGGGEARAGGARYLCTACWRCRRCW